MAVEWLALTGMGFLAATVLVVAMGRRTTARWERESLARRPRRPPEPGDVRAEPGRVRALLARTRAGVVDGAASLGPPLRAAAAALGSAGHRARAHLPAVPRRPTGEGVARRPRSSRRPARPARVRQVGRRAAGLVRRRGRGSSAAGEQGADGVDRVGLG